MPQVLERPPPIPIKWVFILSTFVIVVALSAVLVWLFTTTSRYQYPMMVALLCFALSNVACLLFASQAKIEATLPIAAITMGGPSVIWIGVFVIYSYLFPLPAVSQEQSFVYFLREQTYREGWRTFPEWVDQLGDLGQEVLQDEGSHVRQALDSSFNTGPGKQKVINPIIDTLFVYLNEKMALKFQRIRGSKGDTAEIYFRPSTTQPGTASSVLLAKSNERIVVDELGGQSDWKVIRTETLDCLIISVYSEGMLRRGDLLYTSTNKYRKDTSTNKDRKNGNAVLNMGILAVQSIQEPKSWLFRGLPFPRPDEVPLVFKKRPAAWNSNTDGVMSQLADWFGLLDQNPLDPRLDSSAKFIGNVRSMLPNQAFSTFYKSAEFKSAYSVRLDDLQDAVVVTFERK